MSAPVFYCAVLLRAMPPPPSSQEAKRAGRCAVMEAHIRPRPMYRRVRTNSCARLRTHVRGHVCMNVKRGAVTDMSRYGHR